MEHTGEQMEEGWIGVFEEHAELYGVFLRLQDGAESVDVGDAVHCHKRAVEDDMVVGVTVLLLHKDSVYEVSIRRDLVQMGEMKEGVATQA